jgi:hypothetical protein
MVVQSKIYLDKWSPLRSLRFAHQMQAGFLWSSISLPRIARNARANNVFPSGRATTIPRSDVIEVKIFSFENLPAILAGISIPLKNVVSRELHFLLRQAIKHHQQNDAGYADFEGNRVNAFGMRFFFREILPLTEIKSLKRAVFIGKDDIGVAFEQERERSSRGADVDRLPEAIEDQNVLVEKRVHRRFNFAPENITSPDEVSTRTPIFAP